MQIDEQYNKGYKFYEYAEYDKAYNIFLNLAKDGEFRSQKILANMLITGTGTKKDISTGYSWMKKVADQNDAEAEYLYGWYALENINNQEGLKYIRKSAFNDYVDAVYTLAGFYLYGMYSCQKNLQKSASLYEQAFVLGKKEAINDLLSVKVQQIGKYKTFIYFLRNIRKFI